MEQRRAEIQPLRLKSSAFRNNNFDLLRLAAAFQVALFHTITHLHIPAAAAALHALDMFPGVPVFFVISGFLISRSYEQSDTLSHYAQNRFLRIYPALWVNVLLSILSVIWLAGLVVAPAQLSVWLGCQLTFFQFYNPNFLRGYGVGVLNGSLWTIPVELQFYALLPLIYRLGLIGRSRVREIVLSVVLIVAYCVYARLLAPLETIPTKLIGVTVFPYLFIFLIGVFVQRNFDIVQGWLAGKCLLWLLGYVAFELLADQVGWATRGNYLNVISILLLGMTALSAAYSRPGLAHKLLHGNDISYGLYIYHMPVVNALVFLGLLYRTEYAALALGIAAIFALGSWLIVERTALRLKPRSLRPQGQAA